jgi:hypothetical protein
MWGGGRKKLGVQVLESRWWCRVEYEEYEEQRARLAYTHPMTDAA